MDIRLSDIAVRLPDTRKLLFRIQSFTVSSGSRLLIEGASGIGKTTLLHLTAGLFLPDEGVVEVGGNRVNALSDADRARFRRRHMGMIFQKLNLIDHLTAAENVLLALPRGPRSAARAREVLDEVNLKGRYDDRSAWLSLGEQQRVAVCRVLARRPDVVLADEPTSSLDSANAAVVMEAIFRAAEGRTLVVVSHDQRLRDRFETVREFGEIIAS